MLDGMKGLFTRFGRKESTAPAPIVRTSSVNPFHAVSIDVGPQACDAAKARIGVRFLSREAPRLPLADCGRTDCSCRYVHHDDRRSFARRISDNRDALPPAPYSGPERRLPSSPGRRIQD
jgi:hypothetical protein